MEHPNVEQCEKLLNRYDTPEHVKAHCRAVAQTACKIAEALNKKGYALDLDLVMAAGMLHDIVRTQDKHGEAGADIMEELGYDKVSRIIRVHMTYASFSPISKVTETDIVCLSDRLVIEDEYVGIDKRMDYIIDKARRNGHPESKPFILKNKKTTEKFISEIEDAIGMTIDELMADGGEIYEDR